MRFKGGKKSCIDNISVQNEAASADVKAAANYPTQREEDRGRTLGLSCPRNTTVICHIILNISEIDLKTDRANSMIKRKEEATLKNVRCGETWFGEDRNLRCCRGEGAMITEKGRRKKGSQGNGQGKTFSKAICWKNQRD